MLNLFSSPGAGNEGKHKTTKSKDEELCRDCRANISKVVGWRGYAAII